MDANLVMFKRDGQRKDFPITAKTTVLGRGEDCSLRIPLVAVSRRHCELLKGDNELRIRDLASSNGTYVNNRRVNEAVLKAGDRLAVGPVVFTVQIDGRPENVKPVKPPKAKSVEELAEEEIVELEADTVDEEVDPISALEALASEVEKKPKQKK